MTAATDTDIQQIKDLITAGQLATQKQFTDLDKKIEVGFAEMDKKIDIGLTNLEKKIEVGFAELKGEISKQDTKQELLEERIGRWEGATTRLSVAILTGLLLTFAKFLFFGKLN